MFRIVLKQTLHSIVVCMRFSQLSKLQISTHINAFSSKSLHLSFLPMGNRVDQLIIWALTVCPAEFANRFNKRRHVRSKFGFILDFITPDRRHRPHVFHNPRNNTYMHYMPSKETTPTYQWTEVNEKLLAIWSETMPTPICTSKPGNYVFPRSQTMKPLK